MCPNDTIRLKVKTEKRGSIKPLPFAKPSDLSPHKSDYYKCPSSIYDIHSFLKLFDRPPPGETPMRTGIKGTELICKVPRLFWTYRTHWLGKVLPPLATPDERNKGPQYRHPTFSPSRTTTVDLCQKTILSSFVRRELEDGTGDVHCQRKGESVVGPWTPSKRLFPKPIKDIVTDFGE